MRTVLSAPAGDCPKCGTRDAWEGTRPHYVPARDYSNIYPHDYIEPEHLEWECVVCDYVKETPTADAKVPA